MKGEENRMHGLDVIAKLNREAQEKAATSRKKDADRSRTYEEVDVASLKTEVDALKRQVLSLRREVHYLHEWLDTVCSPLYMRIWWWLCGWKFYTVGRWYAEYKNPPLRGSDGD
jgi:hypothetical protein